MTLCNSFLWVRLRAISFAVASNPGLPHRFLARVRGYFAVVNRQQLGAFFIHGWKVLHILSFKKLLVMLCFVAAIRDVSTPTCCHYRPHSLFPPCLFLTKMATLASQLSSSVSPSRVTARSPCSSSSPTLAPSPPERGSSVSPGARAEWSGW